MLREFTKHPWAYAVLLTGLGLGVISFLLVWPNRNYQLLIAVALGIGYWLWGVVNHLHSVRLNRRVMLEYAGISLLATALLILTIV